MDSNPDSKASPSSPSSSSSSPSSSPSINHMDHDHPFSILHLLPQESILSFPMTCRRSGSLASSASFWESICWRNWGSGVFVDALVASSSAHERRELSWKTLYRQVSQLGSLSCCRLSSKGGIFPKPMASH